ncbi:MAG: HlyC/CorC family transporter [Negativicutes bacterium]|nr:HlyC/CorC family transporter [Negativicutes bacterium]
MAALCLVAINGFFVVAEFSLVRVRKTRLEELVHQGNIRAKLTMRIVSAIDTYLSAIQLGVTLASLALGWLGEAAIASLLEPALRFFAPDSMLLAHSVSIIIGFTLITLMHVVLGELIPKSLAIQQTEKMALLVSRPLYLFHKVGYPVITLFDHTAAFFLRHLDIKRASESELAHSEEELRMLVSASRRGGVLDPMESELIDNVFDFADRIAREVMVPRQDMVCLFMEKSYEENLQVVRESNHTRYPLCLRDKDHVIGMIHLRDLMYNEFETTPLGDIKRLMREILVVPESMSVAKLLQLMRRRRIHMAVVIDEYGGTAGLVSLEDIIEEIVGEIQDEHDEVLEREVQRGLDGSFEFDGLVLLDEVFSLLNLRQDEHEEDTLGGYIFGKLGRRPEIGDSVPIGSYQFTVLRVTGFRITRVRAVPLPNLPEKEQEE